MTKFLLSTRVACSVYSKSLNFTERISVKYLILPRQALADVCNIDVHNDFAKLAGKHLYKILHLMKLQASSLQLYCSRDPDENVLH